MLRFIRHLKTLSIALALASLAATSAHAEFGDAFDEKNSNSHDAKLEWPEVVFPSAAERGRAFHPGESFTFRAQWGIFSKAGKIQISTDAAKSEDNETDLLTVKLDTRSDGLIRKFYPLTLVSSTTLDAEKWRVLRDEADEKVRSDTSRTLALFDYEKNLVNYQDFDDPERNKTREIPYEIALDYASFILQLRSWDMTIGETYTSCVSTKGKFYFVQMQAMSAETIRTKNGNQKCIRVEPVKVYPQSKTLREGGKMVIWYTDDEQRIPVKIEVKTSVGTARMILEDSTLAEPASFAQNN